MWLTNAFPLPNLTAQPGGKQSMRRLAKWENNIQLQDMYIYLVNLYLNTFVWEGLPETCYEPALERTLFFYGKALFFKDSLPGQRRKLATNVDAGYWHTPVTLGEGINIYWQHIHRTAFSYNFNKTYNIDNSVVVRANRMMYPSYITYQIYAQKLVDAGRTIDVVARNMKHPYIIATTEDQLTSAEEYLRQIYNNENAIFTVKGISQELDEGVKVLPTSIGQGNVLADVWDHKHNLMAEVGERLGIQSSNTDKRERLLSDEVNANNAIVDFGVDHELQARQESADEINKLFGLNISVRLRHQEEVQDVDTLSTMANQSTGQNQG